MDSARVKKLFRNPPREYASAPLWVWNDLLTEAQIRETMRDLAGQGVKQVFVHPRPGLMTPYLSEDWFQLWKVALHEAKRLDMNVWIYDENSYPSGFAGGWVPELMPESRGRGLHFRETKQAPKWDHKTFAVFRLADGKAENVTQQIKAGQTLGDARHLIASIHRADNSPWHGGRCYVDLLYPGVTEKFLEVTMDAYEREIGRHFGKRVPGVFTDEPEVCPAGGLPWTDDLPAQFERRWGYSLIEHLASLNQPLGDWRRVRHNFFSTLNDLFIERWAKPYYEYCERRGLEFTGHYWEHEWPRCIGVTDNMSMAAWQQRPGVDMLMNQYAENTHAQFGNVRSCREIASIANQLGRERTLVEIYGAGGWDLRFEDMKRIGDWLQVLGVNAFDEHLSYVTLRGARKNDHPQSFSYHEPWWPAYHVIANYFSRLSAALSQGEQVNRILVIEPTTTAWMYQGDSAKLAALGDSFFKLLMSLEAAQIEYDLGCEDIIARHGAVKEGQLWVGDRGYDVVVVPPHMENVNSRVADLGESFLASGGNIVCLGKPPERVDGRESSRPAQGAGESGWITATAADAPTLLHRWNDENEFHIQRADGDRGILFHHRRQLADGQLLFLVNTSITEPSAGCVEADALGAERWDLHTGQVVPVAFELRPQSAKVTDPQTGRSDSRHFTWGNRGLQLNYSLPPCGSLLLFLAQKPLKSAPAAANVSSRTEAFPGTTPPPSRDGGQALTPASPLETRRLEPNVLKLDYVDITAGGESKSNVYYYAAAQFAFQKNGLDRNPWDSAVQFKDELISKTFATDSGFTASYRFTIEGAVPPNLAIVIERPDLYTITCNGQSVAANVSSRSKPSRAANSPPSHRGGHTVEFKDWWLDKSFGRIVIAAAAKTGENVITLVAKPFTVWHELEAAFLLGDFTLKPAERGFVVASDTPLKIVRAREKLAVSVNPDGTMWLSRGIGYEGGVADRQPFVVFELAASPDEISRIRVWNYAEAHVHDLASRGVKKLRILGSTTGRPDSFNLDLGTFTLARGGMQQDLNVKPDSVRFVKFEILSNQNGVTYPAPDGVTDNGFVGLAEVQFFTGERRLENVKIHSVSSELASHRRTANHLVDDSGLVGARPGWNEQGHPFYAAGVAYAQTYEVTSPAGRYVVALPGWYGSVAEVKVNNRSAGYIVSAPWECDATKHIRRGENRVEVVVIGTLKNTLGPHHGSPPLGSAWPAMFRNGPENGPPPGVQYHTVGYGLFEPFVLKQLTITSQLAGK